jgi:hypothetical protein
MGNKCATKIQSVFRGYLERDALLKLRRAKLFRLRSVKVVRIQALARRYLGRKYYIALRAEYTRSCQLLQRILRGIVYFLLSEGYALFSDDYCYVFQVS